MGFFFLEFYLVLSFECIPSPLIYLILSVSVDKVGGYLSLSERVFEQECPVQTVCAGGL